MGLEKRPLWQPLASPGPFFVALLVVGAGQAFRSAAASVSQESEENAGSGKNCRTSTAEGNRFPAGLGVEKVRTSGSEDEPFCWPARLERPDRPKPMVPRTMSFLEWSHFRAELVTDVYRRLGADPVADVGDALLRGPEMLFDEVFTCIASLPRRSALHTWEDEESRTVSARMLDMQFGGRNQRIFSVFLQQWTDREQKYLSTFEESRANTIGFQNRTEGVDLHELELDQRKIVWDVLRRTYLARYKMRSEEQIREEAWYFGRWSGMDFVVLPPLIGAYLYYRGLNKQISMGDMALRIFFEPGSDFIHRKRDRPAAMALEWTVKGCPVGIIASAGLRDGRYGLDFVGIGTSIGAARSAVEYQRGEVQR